MRTKTKPKRPSERVAVKGVDVERGALVERLAASISTDVPTTSLSASGGPPPVAGRKQRRSWKTELLAREKAEASDGSRETSIDEATAHYMTALCEMVKGLGADWEKVSVEAMAGVQIFGGLMLKKYGGGGKWAEEIGLGFGVVTVVGASVIKRKIDAAVSQTLGGDPDGDGSINSAGASGPGKNDAPSVGGAHPGFVGRFPLSGPA